MNISYKKSGELVLRGNRSQDGQTVVQEYLAKYYNLTAATQTTITQKQVPAITALFNTVVLVEGCLTNNGKYCFTGSIKTQGNLTATIVFYALNTANTLTTNGDFSTPEIHVKPLYDADNATVDLSLYPIDFVRGIKYVIDNPYGTSGALSMKNDGNTTALYDVSFSMASDGSTKLEICGISAADGVSTILTLTLS